MPWIVLSVAMMTEVAAYPAAAWALYAMVVALSAPSVKHDVLAILAVALAFFARGELIGLAIVFPLALVAYEIGRAPGGGVRSRAAGTARALVKGHPVLVGVVGVIGLSALVLYVQGRLASVLGIYSVYQNSAHLAYGSLPRSVPEHLATFSLAFGVVPFVIALAWIGANVVRPASSPGTHAFACVGACVAVVLFVQATNFDLVVNDYIHDRFLIYFVPVVLIGTVLGVTDTRPPRWSLLPSLLLVVAGFAFGEIPWVTWGQFAWLDPDTPISTIYRVLTEHLGGLTHTRIVLIVLAVGGTALFGFAARRGRSMLVTAGTLGFLSVAMVLTTWAIFDRTFNAVDHNGRPITQSQHGVMDWVDQRVGPGSTVTALMYPISSDWFVNQERWIDLVYFNKSIERIGHLPGDSSFDYVGLWFPKLDLHFNEQTGAVQESPSRWILASDTDSRYRVAGPGIASGQGGTLIDAGSRWRLAWRALGAYDDGWTKPGVPVEVRVYPRAGQRHPEIRGLALVLRGPDDVQRRPVTLTAQGKTTHAVVTPSASTLFANVCVPLHGYADVRLDVKGSSAIPGDLATLDQSNQPRQGGVHISSLAEADEIGGRC
jgi:hypothetical protein